MVWVHAVSVGETKAATPLVKKIKQAYPQSIVLVSSITETGFKESKSGIPEADYHVYLPLDFLWIIRRIVRRVKPDLVLITETDFWYHFLSSCKNEGASICLINGKLSDNSMKRYNRISWFRNRLFSLIDAYCLQSDHYKERFITLGIDEASMHVTGNLKFSFLGGIAAPAPSELVELKSKLGIPADHLVLTAGSTHEPEEELVLDAVEKVWQQLPDLTLILVPRHPERFSAVKNILEKRKLPFTLFSSGLGNPEAKVILIDAMGKLLHCYQISDLALVAGSYTGKVGGHNILEPSCFGVPVIFGPCMHTQPALKELSEGWRAGLEVLDKDLPAVLLRLLNDASEREKMGNAGRKMVAAMKGAEDMTFQAILKAFSKKFHT